ncbi:hypothetical protein CLVI_22430 [Clostridium vincentii]|uniref:Uncharacterized protein n=2 Tax=Clostridium vincentii TaxID=52704 RepID=A0A2T0BD00_9CLOT|nr:hypothetical protein CLVI_22430 [Clostridium vincentii]
MYKFIELKGVKVGENIIKLINKKPVNLNIDVQNNTQYEKNTN